MSVSLPGGSAGTPDVDYGGDSYNDVEAAVRILHHRRGWAWTLLASVIAVVIYTIIGVTVFTRLTGSAADVSVIGLFVLLALVLVALVACAAETVRLYRRGRAVRARARAQVAHEPPAVHLFGHPLRRPRHILAWIVLFVMFALGPVTLPLQVNAWAYALGVGQSVAFLPQAHVQDCGRSGCTWQTDGILLTDPPVNAQWPGFVPLGKSFPVREPVFASLGGEGSDLMNGGQAAEGIGTGLFFDAISALIVAAVVIRTRRRRRARREAQPPQ